MTATTNRGSRNTASRERHVKAEISTKSSRASKLRRIRTNPEAAAFRRALRDLLSGCDQGVTHAPLLSQVIARLQRAKDPGQCISLILKECSTRGHVGVEVGSSILAGAGTATLEMAGAFVEANGKSPGSDIVNARSGAPPVWVDAWRIVLRGVARVQSSSFNRLLIVLRATHHPSSSIRAVAIEALGEVWTKTDEEIVLIRTVLESQTEVDNGELSEVAARSLEAVLHKTADAGERSHVKSTHALFDDMAMNPKLTAILTGIAALLGLINLFWMNTATGVGFIIVSAVGVLTTTVIRAVQRSRRGEHYPAP